MEMVGSLAIQVRQMYVCPIKSLNTYEKQNEKQIITAKNILILLTRELSK